MRSPPDFIGPVNIGNPHELTVMELARRIIDLTGSRSEIKSMPVPTDDPRQRQPDISLARTKLDWQPRVPLEEGLMQTISYFESRLQRSPA
jgi:UDP-glucuronate decarboxylase